MPNAAEDVRNSITHSLLVGILMYTLERTGPISLKLYNPLPHNPNLQSWMFITEQKKQNKTGSTQKSSHICL